LEPLSPTTVRRPFHWGLVVLVGDDWTGDYPEVVPDLPVTASERVLLIPVRHAQDTDEFDGEYLRFAQAEVVVRRWDQAPTSMSPLHEVYRGQLQLPAGSVTVGDADESVVVPVTAGANTVTVSFDRPSQDNSPERVWVDLAPTRSATYLTVLGYQAAPPIAVATPSTSSVSANRPEEYA
jgi:hypothetical protein